VMPFANMSGDQNDYFSDGISEDLTTSLSRFGDLFVIARDSAFKYKGQHVDAKLVGRDLGVRYLLQGSVRRDAEGLRITAQLVDAGSSKQIWAETYDRAGAGIFAVQDEVTQKIVVTLVAHMTRSEVDRISRKPSKSLAAYDAYLRANALVRNMERDRAKVNDARALYEQAIAADANFAPAYQGLANVHFLLWGIACPEQPGGCEFHQPAVLDRAQAVAQQAVDLDPSRAEAYAMLGWIFNFQNRYDKALTTYERAFALNPNYAEGRYGLLLSHAGRAPEAIEYMKRIMRLDPLHPPVYGYWLGKGYFFIGQYETAIELIRSASQRIPGHLTSRVLLATVAAHMGRNEEARAAAADVLRIDPNLTIAGWLKFMRLAREEDVERLASGMRKAGLPE
jgi:adenylate cyclase